MAVDTLEDLANQSVLDYGSSPRFVSTVKRIPGSNEVLNRIGAYVEAHPDNQFAVDDGVAKVRSDPRFAYLGDYWPLLYRSSQEPCNTRVVGRTFVKNYVSLVMPKNMPYEETINHQLLRLKLEGVLEKYEKKWFEFGPCTDDDVQVEFGQAGAKTLGMKEMGGAFILLAITTLLAFVVAALERVLCGKKGGDYPVES
eukprot:m.28337 g.28337  ORF g.28337 m.28337 type:complete len:198 (+) comp30699_c0_seq1:881-1474(+)